MGLDINSFFKSDAVKKMAFEYDEKKGNGNKHIDAEELFDFTAEVDVAIKGNKLDYNDGNVVSDFTRLVQESADMTQNGAYVGDDVYGATSTAQKETKQVETKQAEVKQAEAKTVTNPQKETKKTDKQEIQELLAAKYNPTIAANVVKAMGDFSTKEDVDNMYSKGKKALKKAKLWGKDNYKKALIDAQIEAAGLLSNKEYDIVKQEFYSQLRITGNKEEAQKAYDAKLKETNDKYEAQIAYDDKLIETGSRSKAFAKVKEKYKGKGSYYDDFEVYTNHGLNFKGSNKQYAYGAVNRLEKETNKLYINTVSGQTKKRVLANASVEHLYKGDKKFADMRVHENMKNYRRERIHSMNDIVNGYTYVADGDTIEVKGIGTENFTKLVKAGLIKDLGKNQYDIKELSDLVGDEAGYDIEQNVNIRDFSVIEERESTLTQINTWLTLSGQEPIEGEGNTKDITRFCGIKVQNRLTYSVEKAARAFIPGAAVGAVSGVVAEALTNRYAYSGDTVVKVLKDSQVNANLTIDQKAVLQTVIDNVINKHKNISATNPGEWIKLPKDFGGAALLGALGGGVTNAAISGITQNNEIPVFTRIDCDYVDKAVAKGIDPIKYVHAFIDQKMKKTPELAQAVKDLSMVFYYEDPKNPGKGTFDCNGFNKEIDRISGNLITNRNELLKFIVNNSKITDGVVRPEPPKPEKIKLLAEDSREDIQTDIDVKFPETAKKDWYQLAKKYECDLEAQLTKEDLAVVKGDKEKFMRRLMKVMQANTQVVLTNPDAENENDKYGVSFERLVELTKLSFQTKANGGVRKTFANVEGFDVDKYIEALTDKTTRKQYVPTIKFADGSTCSYNEKKKTNVTIRFALHTDKMKAQKEITGKSKITVPGTPVATLTAEDGKEIIKGSEEEVDNKIRAIKEEYGKDNVHVKENRKYNEKK